MSSKTHFKHVFIKKKIQTAQKMAKSHRPYVSFFKDKINFTIKVQGKEVYLFILYP